jgi:prephenate dehydrogenase
MALFKQVTIVGLGLIGGSLGMAIPWRHPAEVTYL